MGAEERRGFSFGVLGFRVFFSEVGERRKLGADIGVIGGVLKLIVGVFI